MELFQASDVPLTNASGPGEFMSDRNARSAAEQENKPVVSPTKASQGTKGHNVRYVLSLGTIGAAAALALAYFAFFAG